MIWKPVKIAGGAYREILFKLRAGKNYRQAGRAKLIFKSYSWNVPLGIFYINTCKER